MAYTIPNYPGWRPYCLVCSTMARMKKTSFGYECIHCGNKINPDMTHLDNSQEQTISVKRTG